MLTLLWYSDNLEEAVMFVDHFDIPSKQINIKRMKIYHDKVIKL
jgi:hypothetical protein